VLVAVYTSYGPPRPSAPVAPGLRSAYRQGRNRHRRRCLHRDRWAVLERSV